MSKLLSIQSLVSESSTHSRLVKRPTSVTEKYLGTAISILTNTNNSIQEATSVLYNQVLEASSRKEENEKFAEYFKEYKEIISKYQRDMGELISRFRINVENFVDANKAILDKTTNKDIVDAPKIQVYKYTNLSDPNVPRIDIYAAFKKEFKFIGQMMQDLGASLNDDEVKANVLATICNNLNNDLMDGWLEKCMEKITDCDDCTKEDFATIMYKKFIPGEKEEIAIDIATVQQARLALMNSSTLVNTVIDSMEAFNAGLEKVAAEIGSMFFRNKDHIMPIKTDAEGVADRDYHLSDYSFNQFNVFMATKCNQITELCNLYLIALSIKTDCIFKYLQQAKDIIDAAIHGVDSTPNNVSDPGDDHPEEDPVPADSDENNEPTVDDNSSDDDFDTDYDDEDNDFDEKPIETNTDKEVVQGNTVEEDSFDEAAYLFEAALFVADRIVAENYTQEYFTALLNEADLDQIKNITDNANKNVLNTLINAARNLFDKFRKVLQSGLRNKIDNILKKRAAIAAVTIPNGMVMDVIDYSRLSNIKVEPFNYSSDKDNLENEAKYIDAKWGSVLGDNKDNRSLRDRMLDVATTINVPYKDEQRTAGFEFLKNYEKYCNELEAQLNILKNAENNVKVVAKQLANESVATLESTLVHYFYEEDNLSGEPADNKDNNQDQSNPAQGGSDNNDDKSSKNPDADATKIVRVYLKANINMLGAKLSILQINAKKHIAFLSKLASTGNVDIKEEQ